jgi:SagB-type dehydrogenase family enzyme
MDEINFSQLFHQYTKKFHRRIPMDSSLWPPEWTTVFYKTYPRLPKIKLPERKINFDLFEALKRRRSKREMGSGPISLDQVSIILQNACGITHLLPNGNGGRAQASGGARFPIEIYCLINRPGSGLIPGFFHYDVKNNQLDILWQKKFSADELKKIATYEFFADSSLVIFMTAIFRRTQNKYGQRGYRFILQESGHIGQNIYLVCEALNLKCCALGGFRISDEQIEKLLDVDGIEESLVYTLAIGD